MRSLWDLREWEHFYTNSGIDRWCNVDSDWFVQTLSEEQLSWTRTMNPSIEHSLGLWEELEATEELEQDDGGHLLMIQFCTQQLIIHSVTNIIPSKNRKFKK